MTSRTFASFSGSVLTLNVSIRRGWIFHFRQIRATPAKEITNSPAKNRADQCVVPSRASGRPPSASVATTTSASSISGGRPLRGSSSSALIPLR
jgi:hypothetical protein